MAGTLKLEMISVKSVEVKLIVNWFFIPTLIAALFLTWIAWKIVCKTKNQKAKYVLLCACFLAAIPAFLLAYPEFLPQIFLPKYCDLRAR